MGKTYIDTVKYLIYTSVDIGGLVEKPDVVGAIFGQTEGLLGDELDLRDLQKNGRIGRIEVDLKAREGRTVGTIKIPSSLDMVETCIVGASLESVDRIGPCEASLKVIKVEDTRNLKRKVLVDRAKHLLREFLVHEIPESKEISDMVRDEVKTAEITEYGPERLTAGPGVSKSNEVVFVEGRADVVNMLKNDMSNVIAIGGAKVPPSLVELSKKKEVTVFLDGDRGGDIILNELVQGGAEIEFVARAPPGKEVEELTRKELIKCIRAKVAFETGSFQKNRRYEDKFRKFKSPEQKEAVAPEKGVEWAEPESEKREVVASQVQAPQAKPVAPEKFDMKRPEPLKPVTPNVRIEEKRFDFRKSEFVRPSEPERRPFPEFRKPEPKAELKPEPKLEQKPEVVKAPEPEKREYPELKRPEPKKPEPVAAPPPPVIEVDRKFFMKELEELNNTLKARFYDDKHVLKTEMKVRDVIRTLESSSGIDMIVFDGIITQRLVDLASSKGVKVLAGVKIGNVNKKPAGIEVVTK